ncbi:recombinase family protein [Paenibacillus sp. FSL H3-0333]|uniref:recombinase family protein n=1 Tax=Paenibacillus sp. FSL H3-0333 TaxID=2921373 RepID=UPI0030F8D457
MGIKKRVAAFYRVSTKGQLEGNDIPLQRRACQEFINSKGWVLVKEYTEKGVSGYKTAIEDRDEIQRAKYDAENSHFDVLLCFMFDRLGRRTYETPLLLEWFNSKGIEVWSVKEGQQEFTEEGHDVTNFLRFWQSNNESQKTSIRVDEKHTQMAEDGAFRGGTAPFGYRLTPSGIKNKKGKELMKLQINEEQAAVVRQMFNMVIKEGFGSNRIAKFLNENTIPTATGGKWNTAAVNFILRNPVYKGYPAYGKRKSVEGIFETKGRAEWTMPEKQQLQLVIIDEDDFDNIQLLRSSRSKEQVKDHSRERINTSVGPLLLVGFIKCGYCGSPLTTTYNAKKYTLADGTIQMWKRAVYRCSGKALRKVDCKGQTIYAQNKIEDSVAVVINNYLASVKKIDYIEFARDYDLVEYEDIKETLDKKNQELASEYDELNTLKKEVTKSILGKSAFKPELLNEMIEEKEKELQKLDQEVRLLEEQLQTKKLELSEIKELSENIREWIPKYKEASHDRKKVMLRWLIERITVFKDQIEIEFKLDITKFLSSAGNGNITELQKRTHRWHSRG